MKKWIFPIIFNIFMLVCASWNLSIFDLQKSNSDDNFVEVLNIISAKEIPEIKLDVNSKKPIEIKREAKIIRKIIRIETPKQVLKSSSSVQRIETVPDIRLASVFWGGNPVAILITPIGSRPYSQGNLIHDGWRLKVVDKSQVTIVKEGHEIVLR